MCIQHGEQLVCHGAIHNMKCLSSKSSWQYATYRSSIHSERTTVDVLRLHALHMQPQHNLQNLLSFEVLVQVMLAWLLPVEYAGGYIANKDVSLH